MINKSKKDTNLHSLTDAIACVRKFSKEKFDPSVEIHIIVNSDPKKPEQNIRFSTVLPHGTGKTKKVAVLASKKIEGVDLELSESDIEKLEKSIIRPKVDFDVLITEPRFMPKLAKAARILGPAGVMPNPKTGTVTEDIESAVEQIKKGKVEVKTEKDAPVIHSIMGKLTFTDKALEENFLEVFNNVKQSRPSKIKGDWIKSVYICSSMGPSFRIDTAQL